jgi:hypothetical protein
MDTRHIPRSNKLIGPSRHPALDEPLTFRNRDRATSYKRLEFPMRLASVKESVFTPCVRTTSPAAPCASAATLTLTNCSSGAA